MVKADNKPVFIIENIYEMLYRIHVEVNQYKE